MRKIQIGNDDSLKEKIYFTLELMVHGKMHLGNFHVFALCYQSRWSKSTTIANISRAKHKLEGPCDPKRTVIFNSYRTQGGGWIGG